MPNTEAISGGTRRGGPVNQPSRSGPIQGLRIIALLLFVPMLSVSRAASQDVLVDHDRAADFSSFESFAWKDVAEGSLKGTNDLAHSRIVNTIKYQLTQAGLVETDASPDLFVAYYASTKEATRVDPSTSGYSWGRTWTFDPYWPSSLGTGTLSGSQVVTYGMGALVVDIWDARTSKLVFRGVVEDIVSTVSSRDDREISTSTERIVKEFLGFGERAQRKAEKESRKIAHRDFWRRWYLGAGISGMTTSGYYGNNAAIINTKMFGEDGIPFTGDPGEVTTCIALEIGYYPEVDPFCDPRPDDLVAREGSIDDSLGYGVTAAFDLTPHIQLAFDASYYKSEVGPIDVYATETYPFIFHDQVIELVDRDFKEPIPAGELSQIPLTLTALYRMRPNKSIRPYFGAGAGVILSGFEQDDQVADLQSRLETLRIRGYANEKGRNVTPSLNRSEFEFDGGLLRFNDEIEVDADDAYEWHLTAGLEYAIDDRFSLTFDARYVFADREVSIEIMGHEQLDIFTWPDELYHPNGTLAVFSPTGDAPNPFCFQARNGYGCKPTFPPDKTVTPVDGTVVMDMPTGPFTCPGRADFDANGSRDYCYKPGLKSDSGRDILGMWVVQGGAIEMSGYAFAIGLRARLGPR